MTSIEVHVVRKTRCISYKMGVRNDLIYRRLPAYQHTMTTIKTRLKSNAEAVFEGLDAEKKKPGGLLAPGSRLKMVSLRSHAILAGARLNVAHSLQDSPDRPLVNCMRRLPRIISEVSKPTLKPNPVVNRMAIAIVVILSKDCINSLVPLQIFKLNW